jgi:hypothetical protein
MSSTPGAVDPAARARWLALQRSAFGPTVRVYTNVVLSAILGAGLGVLVAYLVPDPTAGLGLALVVAIFPVLVAAWPLHDRGVRATVELGLDYERRTKAVWRRVFGSKPPMGRAASRDWLDAQSADARPISMLVMLGRLDEADRSIESASFDDAAPTDVFLFEVIVQTRRLVGGQRPELEALREHWRTLPDADRGLAREVLAVLEAHVVAVDGRGPATVMIGARDDVTDVAWSCTALGFVGRWVLLAAVLPMLTVVVRWAITR